MKSLKFEILNKAYENQGKYKQFLFLSVDVVL